MRGLPIHFDSALGLVEGAQCSPGLILRELGSALRLSRVTRSHPVRAEAGESPTFGGARGDCSDMALDTWPIPRARMHAQDTPHLTGKDGLRIRQSGREAVSQKSPLASLPYLAASHRPVNDMYSPLFLAGDGAPRSARCPHSARAQPELRGSESSTPGVR
jgi:hypothetical protein